MVNMNLASGKENERNEINGIIQEDSGTSARCSEKENIVGNTCRKSNSPPIDDTANKRVSVSNGVYINNFNSVPLGSTNTSQNDPSSSKIITPSQVQHDEIKSLEVGSHFEEIKQETGSSVGNECGHLNAQNLSKPRGKLACRYDENSSSEDEECCIYTYKGDSNQMADLPSSFFRLDLMAARPNGNSGNSSPDMDYLEMDFDPGPSNGRDSSSSSDCAELRTEDDLLSLDVSSAQLPPEHSDAVSEPMLELEVNPPTPLSPLSTPSPSPVWNTRPQFSPSQPSSSGVVWNPPVSPEMQPPPAQSIGCDLPTVTKQSASSCFCLQPSTSSSVSIDENFNDGDTGSMIWKEEEAKEKQINQIGTSLCGATAVINTLLALNVPYSVNAVKQACATRFRNESAPIPEYLMSRCHAGVTHVELISALQTLSQGAVYARFFHMFPQRSVSLTSWLSHWLKRGAVPILTLNTQRNGSVEVVDFWHHQMVYGISSQGVHLTNPLETQSEVQLRPQLASPSVLLIRRQDVLSRWTPDTALHQLASPSLPQWRHLNVLGQVVNVIREGKCCNHSQQHITIPASYSSGVTLAILRTNPACDELRLAHELPVDPLAPT